MYCFFKDITNFVVSRINWGKALIILFCFSFMVFFIIRTNSICAEDFHVFEGKEILIFYEPDLEPAAREVFDIFPETKASIENILGWNLNLKPSVLLVKNSLYFQKMAESPLTIAFAVPEKNLIVIDCTKVNIYPFSLKITFKHELSHLLLHQHIKRAFLPRWLDEGVCQWISDGLGDIIMDQRRSPLNRAALRGEFIGLNSMQSGFPSDKESLLLAYEESKSFVVYIIEKFGNDGIISVLRRMAMGENTEKAILNILSMPLHELEKEWHDSLRKRMTWFTYLSYHLYDILFTLMAFVTICAFLIIRKRKKGYSEEEDVNPW